jgi:hypothetical protein
MHDADSSVCATRAATIGKEAVPLEQLDPEIKMRALSQVRPRACASSSATNGSCTVIARAPQC